MKLIRPIIRLLAILAVPLCANAQTPELSADAPIAYTAEDNLLVASGNAVYRDENTRVEADEIRYDRAANIIHAKGNVRVTRTGIRLLAEELTYDATTKSFSAGRFRAGYPPLFMEGESFEGDLEQIDFDTVTLYFREPVFNSPRLAIREGSWTPGESISGTGLRLNALGAFGIPLPGITFDMDAPTADIEAGLGFRNRLGAYAQTRWLYPVNPRLSLGGNLDLYSKRGVLIGPALDWTNAPGTLELFLDSGWIHDHAFAERGLDFLGDPIEQSRGFANFGINARNEDASLQLQSRGTYLSDSEFLRDFRDDYYFSLYQPDHYADFTWQQDQFLLNAFARRQINDYYGMVERLPELRAEWLPDEIARSGIYFQAAAAAARYRLQEVSPFPFSVPFPEAPLGLETWHNPFLDGMPDQVARPYHTRLDGSVTLTRPVHLDGGIDLILRGGGRWTHYDVDQADPLESIKEDRWVGELGFDLSRTLARTYRVDRPAWNMEKLRHVTRLSAAYRWHPGAGDAPEGALPYDLYAYHARRPALDLADLLHTDSLREWSVARLGWENRFTVAGAEGDYRELLALHLYQDLNFSAGPGEDEWDALYMEADFIPFPWLSVQYRQKFRTEEGESEASFLRTTLRSSDLWALSLQAEYLQNAIEQYDLAGSYRLTENLGLLASWRYDARLSEWIRSQYGFSRRFANVWQLEMYVAFTNEDEREDDFSVGMRLHWLSF